MLLSTFGLRQHSVHAACSQTKWQLSARKENVVLALQLHIGICSVLVFISSLKQQSKRADRLMFVHVSVH